MLPTPGSHDFAPALIEAIESEPSLLGWEVDGTLVAAILLARVVGRGGVIIDVPSSRRHTMTGIKRAARSAVAIIESIFGLATQTLHLTPESSTADVHIEGEAMVVTGLEDAPPAVLVKVRSEMRRASHPFLIWVRDEDKDEAPLWLLDLFACWTPMGDFEPPPEGLERRAIIPSPYIDDLHSLLRLSHIHPPLDLHISNLVAAAELHPRIAAGISQTGSQVLSDMVRGQRLLASPFTLPQGWRGHLDAWRALHEPNTSPLGSNNVGYAGGPGGVSTWGERAGELPTAEKMLGPAAEDWFCTPDNVAGAWELAIRHRLRVLEPGETALYALNSSALERTEQSRKDMNPKNQRDAARKRRLVLDEALEQMLVSV